MKSVVFCFQEFCHHQNHYHTSLIYDYIYLSRLYCNRFCWHIYLQNCSLTVIFCNFANLRPAVRYTYCLVISTLLICILTLYVYSVSWSIYIIKWLWKIFSIVFVNVLHTLPLDVFAIILSLWESLFSLSVSPNSLFNGSLSPSLSVFAAFSRNYGKGFLYFHFMMAFIYIFRPNNILLTECVVILFFISYAIMFFYPSYLLLLVNTLYLYICCYFIIRDFVYIGEQTEFWKSL